MSFTSFLASQLHFDFKLLYLISNINYILTTHLLFTYIHNLVGFLVHDCKTNDQYCITNQQFWKKILQF